MKIAHVQHNTTVPRFGPLASSEETEQIQNQTPLYTRNTPSQVQTICLLKGINKNSISKAP